jgi:hypothetical protein
MRRSDESSPVEAEEPVPGHRYRLFRVMDQFVCPRDPRVPTRDRRQSGVVAHRQTSHLRTQRPGTPSHPSLEVPRRASTFGLLS